jgi:hypothetical protein
MAARRDSGMFAEKTKPAKKRGGPIRRLAVNEPNRQKSVER